MADRVLGGAASSGSGHITLGADARYAVGGFARGMGSWDGAAARVSPGCPGVRAAAGRPLAESRAVCHIRGILDAYRGGSAVRAAQMAGGKQC